MECTTFFVDESGPKTFHTTGEPASERQWFAYGGILINDEDIPDAKKKIEEFRKRWPQLDGAPLHSAEIRNANKNFSWLRGDENKELRTEFLEDLDQMLLALPVIGLSCVIDRKGYEARYGGISAQERWRLCKTAFAISIERAAKFAIKNQRSLRVYVERCSAKDDARLKGYFDEMKQSGLWFDSQKSAGYTPLSSAQLNQTLYEFALKYKQSLLMTIADLYLWPMCVSGYNKNQRNYVSLVTHARIIDCSLSPSEIESMGIKYSCFP